MIPSEVEDFQKFDDDDMPKYEFKKLSKNLSPKFDDGFDDGNIDKLNMDSQSKNSDNTQTTEFAISTQSDLDYESWSHFIPYPSSIKNNAKVFMSQF